MKPCCDIEKKEKREPLCPECGKRGKSVQLIIPVQHIKREFQKHVQDNAQYYFCKTPACPIVYFAVEENNFLFRKEHLRTLVWQKEKSDSVPVCYCFDYTKENIAREIKETEKTLALEDITQKVKAKLCACEIKNPQGSCCLGNVAAVIKSIK